MTTTDAAFKGDRYNWINHPDTAISMKPPRLKLAQKGILIVVLPLLFQSAIYMLLKSQLAATEHQAQTQELSKKIVANITVATVQTGELFGSLVLFYNTRDNDSLKALDNVTSQARSRIENLATLLETEGDDPDEAKKVRRLSRRFFSEVKRVRDNTLKDTSTNPSLMAEFAASVKFRDSGTELSNELSSLAEQEERRVLNTNQQQKEFREALEKLLDFAVFLNALMAVAMGAFFLRGTVSNLSVLKDNAWRLAAEQPLRKPIDAEDEIGEVDRMFHSMARAVNDAAEKEKHMIETLQISEERLASVINTVPVALVVADEKGSIESLNPTAEALFSYPSAKLVSEPITKLLNVSGTDSDPRQLLPRLKHDTAVRPAQMEGVSSEHEIIPVEVTVTSFDTSEGNRTLATILDVTERYKLERLKREFVAMVSHDIRAPLSSMRAIFELVGSGSLGNIPEEAQKKLNIADSNAEKLLQMVTKLLDLEKLEAGLVELSMHDFQLQELVDASKQLVSEQLSAKSLTVNAPETQLTGFGDKDALTQVMTNLLSNAIKYSPTESVIEISIEALDDAYKLKVHDNGPGIPRRKQAEIFERFKQANTQRDKAKGFGLGLAICKTIVAQHGEKIGVESEEGEGSTFWFTVTKAASDSQLHESSV